ncbi:basic amino acid ABC transporter substrate-binding protein [Paludifilum halophilum]|uniref:Basic amino acid ABC transporter substrate-binding protein n=1 Tax=Paludifilum halophilum TaxID=1642702 RepID=A0A235B7V0_9BACL|nr:basic amino acid ABC transporter substrate-binding protein [Paludifilum halophilum]OYD08059.1 basic amino acid ABC transporter substrate-binding protein [Paludifilum halophilum]
MVKPLSGIIPAILSLFLVITGCGAESSNDTGEGHVLKVGTDAAYPPFEKQEGDGTITGFDIEVMKAIAAAEGFEIEVEHTGWDPLLEGLKNGKLDAGISAITITEDRKKNYDFSDPYFEAKQLILVPESSKSDSLQDLKGKKIGVQAATTGEEVVKKAFGKTYQGLRGYDSTPAAIDDLGNGRVDAVVADNGVVKEYMKRLPEGQFKIVEDDSFEPEQYGIAVQKGNQEVLDKINSGLKTIKKDGTYDQIYKKYFGEE